ncbi:kinase-like protein [Laetiporus sulphureus 93-53]|uniref:Kinase-like protein n=1 Tax=Laetiporus sulphureus 93-53 TaxID=1314785 RepID=A0A165E337_9APHY|nr:kinase-like protein [Laetiporus sulphureus 93-53]KZT06149.1 kinase-like protein [Laetiporus sulphureus 93-53]
MSQPPTPSRDADRTANEQCLSSRGSEGATLVTGIREACTNIIVHRRQAQQLSMDVSTLFSMLKDNVGLVTPAEFAEMLDEILKVLTSVYPRARELSQYGLLQALWRSGQVGYGLEQCNEEVGAALDKWEVAVAISLNNLRNPLVRIARQDAEEWWQYIAEHRAELFKFTKQFLRSRQLMQQAAELHKRGHPAAERMMELSQLLLRLPIQSADSTKTVNESLSKEEHDGCRERLVDFQRLTGMPPTIKILNGQVKKLGDRPLVWGNYSELWSGVWLGKIQIVLRVQDIVVSQPAVARFEEEARKWAKLKNPNVLPFFGIVTDLGPIIHTATPWCEYGNILEFMKNNPAYARTRLLLGAAQGLRYLHQENVVHGNVKCTNFLINEKGNARIADYSMIQVVAEITKKRAARILDEAELTRWLAPELVCDASLPAATAACDVWSFGMAMLECYTSCPPYEELSNNMLVADAHYRGQYPTRPKDTTELTDDIWEILISCWRKRPGERLSMDEVVSRMRRCI